MTGLLIRVTARLLLVAVVCVTVLVQYRTITMGGWDLVATSSSHGWIVFTDPPGNAAFFKMRPRRPLGEPLDVLFDEELMGDDLSWYGLCAWTPPNCTLAVYYWVIWSPLLLLNAVLWWLRCRKRGERIDEPPVDRAVAGPRGRLDS